MKTRSLLVLLPLFCGCPKMTMNGDSGRPPECTQRSDCPMGKICTAQQYCDFCSSSGQCSVREVCSQADGGTGAALCGFRPGWGDACATNDQCPAGQWCHQGLCADRDSVQLCVAGLTLRLE